MTSPLARLVRAALLQIASTEPPSDARLVKVYKEIEDEVERRAAAAADHLDAIAAEAQGEVTGQLAHLAEIGPGDMDRVTAWTAHALDAADLSQIEDEIRAIGAYARDILERVTMRQLTKEAQKEIDRVTDEGVAWVEEAPQRIADGTRESLSLTKPILSVTFAAAFIHQFGVWSTFSRLSIANAMRRIERRTVWSYGEELGLMKAYYNGPLDTRTRTICGNGDAPPYGMAKRAWPVEAIAASDNGFDSANLEDDCGGPQCRHRLYPISEAFMPERQVNRYHMVTEKDDNGNMVTYPVADDFNYDAFLNSVRGDPDFNTDQRPLDRRLPR